MSRRLGANSADSEGCHAVSFEPPWGMVNANIEHDPSFRQDLDVSVVMHREMLAVEVEGCSPPAKSIPIPDDGADVCTFENKNLLFFSYRPISLVLVFQLFHPFFEIQHSIQSHFMWSQADLCQGQPQLGLPRDWNDSDGHRERNVEEELSISRVRENAPAPVSFVALFDLEACLKELHTQPSGNGSQLHTT